MTVVDFLALEVDLDTSFSRAHAQGGKPGEYLGRIGRVPIKLLSYRLHALDNKVSGHI